MSFFFLFSLGGKPDFGPGSIFNNNPVVIGKRGLNGRKSKGRRLDARAAKGMMRTMG